MNPHSPLSPSPWSRAGWQWTGLWLLLCLGLAYGWHLGSIGLVDETEPLFAEAARQMLVRHDWITPYFNEATRFDKPPLIYWLMALAYQVVGVNEWAVRLPSVLSVGVLAVLMAQCLRVYGRFPQGTTPGNSPTPLAPQGDGFPATPYTPNSIQPQPLTPWWVVCMGIGVLAWNAEMIAWGRTGVSDMLLTGCMDSGLLCFFQGYAAETHSLTQRRWYWGFYGCLALAILAKGPVGIVLPALIIGAFLLYVGQWRSVWAEIFPLRGLGLVMALAIPWFLLVLHRHGRTYWDSFFGYHNLERFTQVVNNHWAPWYFYFVVVLVGFAPWSLYLPLALGRLRLHQWQRWRRYDRSQQLGLFAGFWFLGIFGFFTIAVTKLPSYVLPLMPAAAILMALFWQDYFKPDPPVLPAQVSDRPTPPKRLRALPILGWINTLGFGAIAIAAFSSYGWITHVIYDPAMPQFPQALQQSTILARTSLICGLTALGLGLALMQRKAHTLWLINLLGVTILFLAALWPTAMLMDYHRQLPLRDLAQEIIRQRQPQEPVMMWGLEKPSLVFYTRNPVIFNRNRGKLLESLAQQTAPTDTFLLLTHPRRLEEWLPDTLNPDPLAQAGAYVLVRLPKAPILALPPT